MFSLVLLTPSYALGLPPGRQTWLQVHFPLGRNTTMTKTEGKTNVKFISCFSELIIYERYMCSFSSSAFEDLFTFGAWTMNLHEDFIALKMQPWEFQLHFFPTQATEGFHVSRFFRGFWRSDLNLNQIHLSTNAHGNIILTCSSFQ